MIYKSIKISILCTLLFTFTGNLYSQNYADAIIGKWRSADGKTVVEIYKAGQTYAGKIVDLAEPIDASTGKPRTDLKNPDAALRKRPLIGLHVMQHLEYEDGYWQDGKIYSSQNGKSYTCDIWLEGKDVLKMKAYWYFMHHIETWTRVK